MSEVLGAYIVCGERIASQSLIVLNANKTSFIKPTKIGTTHKWMFCPRICDRNQTSLYRFGDQMSRYQIIDCGRCDAIADGRRPMASIVCYHYILWTGTTRPHLILRNAIPNSKRSVNWLLISIKLLLIMKILSPTSVVSFPAAFGNDRKSLTTIFPNRFVEIEMRMQTE